MIKIKYRHNHGKGLTLDCELEFAGAEAESEITPAYPAQAVLITAKAGGVDILPLLDDRIVAVIEEDAVWSQS
jgi:hypothetical protein